VSVAPRYLFRVQCIFHRYMLVKLFLNIQSNITSVGITMCLHHNDIFFWWLSTQRNNQWRILNTISEEPLFFWEMFYFFNLKFHLRFYIFVKLIQTSIHYYRKYCLPFKLYTKKVIIETTILWFINCDVNKRWTIISKCDLKNKDRPFKQLVKLYWK